MQGYLYRNKSDKRRVTKELSNEISVTLHFKEDSSIINPIFTISRTIDMTGKNYLKVNEFHRYYYIEDITVSKQYYILNCKVDVLMSFKDEFLNDRCIVSKNATLFDEYLEDDRFKAEQYTHRDTLEFPFGFDETAQEFILTVCGNPDVTASVTSSNDNNGGSSRPSQNVTPDEYNDLPPSQKDNNDIYIIDDVKPVGSLPTYEPQTRYWVLTQAQYDALGNNTQNDGCMYFISENAPNIKGTRNIFISKELYDVLANRDKYNNTPYYVN